MKILDATCGSRAIWYQKSHPLVTYMDIRKEKIFCGSPKVESGKRYVSNINPDVIADFRNTKFKDNEFDVVVFDPPHIIISRDKQNLSMMEKRYGVLYNDNWKTILKEGINELFRIIKPKGMLIFKWSEVSKPIDDVLKLFPYPPLFGTRTGRPIGVTSHNHWICFLKYNINKNLDLKLGVEGNENCMY